MIRSRIRARGGDGFPEAPAGYAYLVSGDGSYLTTSDGYYLLTKL